MNSPERKEINVTADESGYSEKRTDLLIDRKMGKGLATNNTIFSKKQNKKKGKNNDI